MFCLSNCMREWSKLFNSHTSVVRHTQPVVLLAQGMKHLFSSMKLHEPLELLKTNPQSKNSVGTDRLIVELIGDFGISTLLILVGNCFSGCLTLFDCSILMSDSHLFADEKLQSHHICSFWLPFLLLLFEIFSSFLVIPKKCFVLFCGETLYFIISRTAFILTFVFCAHGSHTKF